MVAFIKKTTEWGTLSKHVDTVMNHAKNQGAESFGALGTCWGSYPVVKMSGAGLIKCGVRQSSQTITIPRNENVSPSTLNGESSEKNKKKRGIFTERVFRRKKSIAKHMPENWHIFWFKVACISTHIDICHLYLNDTYLYL